MPTWIATSLVRRAPAKVVIVEDLGDVAIALEGELFVPSQEDHVTLPTVRTKGGTVYEITLAENVSQD